VKFFTSKIGWLGVGAGLLLVIGVLGGWAYLNSAAFRRLMVEQVNARLNGRLAVDGHRLSLLAGRLVLTGVRLQRSDGEPFAQVGQIAAGISWPDLLQHSVHIRSLDLDDVRLWLTLDRDNRPLLPGLKTSEPAGQQEHTAMWPVRVDAFGLNDGQLEFRQPSRGRSGRVEQVRIAATLDTRKRQGEGRLRAGPLVWQDGDISRTLPSLAVTGRYSGDHSLKAVFKTTGSSVQVQGRLLLDQAAPAVDLNLELDLALDELRPWIPGHPRLEGRVAAHGRVRGPVRDPAAALHVKLDRGRLAGFAVAPLTANLSYANAMISVKDLAGQGPWGTLKAEGAVDLAGKRIEKASAALTSGRLADLGAALGIEMPAGSGRVKLSCAGPWSHPAAKVELLAQDLAWRRFTFGQLLADADLDSAGVVTFSHLVLEHQGSLVEGRGRLFLQQNDGRWRRDPGLDLALDLGHLEPAAFGLAWPAQPVLNGTVKLGGSVNHLQGDAQLKESRLRWRDRAFSLAGSAHWRDGRLNLSELRLARDRSELRLQGNVQFQEPRTGRWLDAPMIEASLQSQGVRLQDLWPKASGAVTVNAQVKGTPADLAGGFQLDGRDLTLDGQPLSAARIQGRLADDVLYLDNVDVTVAKGQQIQGRGWYGFDQRFELALDTAGIDLERIPSLQRAYPVQGRLLLALKGQGSLQKPVVTAGLTVQKPRLNGQAWPDFHVQASLKERRLDLDADLNFSLKAHGRLDSGDFNVTARLADTDLSPYLAMTGGAQWSGRLSGRLEAEGNWHHLQQIRADLEISDARLRYDTLELLSTRHLTAQLSKGGIDLPACRLDLMQGGYVNLFGAGDLRQGLKLTADGRLPLAALAPFSDMLAGARGALTFEARLGGALDDLQWQADVNLADVGLDIPALDQEVQKLNGHIRIQPRELVVEQVAGQVDGGKFTLAGQVKLDHLKPSSGKLVFTARSLPLQWPDTMDVVVNSSLTLESADHQSTLSGQVVVLEGTYYKDVRLNLLSVVGQPQRAQPVPSTYQLPAWLAAIRLDVAINHRYPLLVDNNLARLQVVPDLKVTGTLGRPVVSGRAQVTEGEVIFRRKSFTVKRGVVDFINPYKIEPTLDIAAEAQIRQWLVSLNLSGTPDKLSFKLSSVPQASESDILSLILLGRTSSELASGQGGGGQSTRQMLASLIATAWGEDVKKRSGVDILEVDTGSDTSDQNSDNIQVTVGKRLSRRLTVKYEVESGSGELIQRAVSEYRFLEHVLASGFQDSVGGYGGELLFRIEF
jgi:translocation and assembly module TamB